MELGVDGSRVVGDSFERLLRFRAAADGRGNSTSEALTTNANGQRLRCCSNASEERCSSIWFVGSTYGFIVPNSWAQLASMHLMEAQLLASWLCCDTCFR